MKINDVLMERVAFNDLQPIHMYALKLIYNGKDLSNAKDSTLDAIDDLMAFGLVANGEQLTQRGAEFAKHAMERGSLEKREKGLRRRKERGQLKRDDKAMGLNEKYSLSDIEKKVSKLNGIKPEDIKAFAKKLYDNEYKMVSDARLSDQLKQIMNS